MYQNLTPLTWGCRVCVAENLSLWVLSPDSKCSNTWDLNELVYFSVTILYLG